MLGCPSSPVSSPLCCAGKPFVSLMIRDAFSVQSGIISSLPCVTNYKLCVSTEGNLLSASCNVMPAQSGILSSLPCVTNYEMCVSTEGNLFSGSCYVMPAQSGILSSLPPVSSPLCRVSRTMKCLCQLRETFFRLVLRDARSVRYPLLSAGNLFSGSCYVMPAQPGILSSLLFVTNYKLCVSTKENLLSASCYVMPAQSCILSSLLCVTNYNSTPLQDLNYSCSRLLAASRSRVGDVPDSQRGCTLQGTLSLSHCRRKLPN
ncbi:hypothetical protein J6590_071990 [Homalodisca vitripennis]|nr:hypothetical protein J6590_071990 [Homalodisca vitripennis]